MFYFECGVSETAQILEAEGILRGPPHRSFCKAREFAVMLRSLNREIVRRHLAGEMFCVKRDARAFAPFSTMLCSM